MLVLDSSLLISPCNKDLLQPAESQLPIGDTIPFSSSSSSYSLGREQDSKIEMSAFRWKQQGEKFKSIHT